MNQWIIGLTAVVFSGGASAWNSDCKHEKSLEESFSVSGEQLVNIIARAGELSISGDSSDEVRATARACASSESLLDEIDLIVYDGDDGKTLEAKVPDSNGWNWGGGKYAFADLEIQVPRSLALAVRDSSGDLEIRDVGPLKLEDSSGSVDLVNINGDLDLRDSSGEIEIQRVKGSVKLVDSSGSIEIRDVDLDVIIPSDSSGEIDINGVGGFVRIDRDSSGSIEVRDVTGDMEVGSDSSGDIVVADIQGDFTVGRDGSGDIRHRNVGGSVKTPTK